MSDRPYITDAIDLGGLKVRLFFSDGTNSTVDVGDYIPDASDVRQRCDGFAIMSGRKILD